MSRSITLFSIVEATDSQLYQMKGKLSEKDSIYAHYLAVKLAHFRAEAETAQNRERVLQELKDEIKKIGKFNNIKWAYKQEIDRIERIIRDEKEQKKHIAKRKSERESGLVV